MCDKVLLQVPESPRANVCRVSYVVLQAKALATRGYYELLSGLCCDEPRAEDRRVEPALAMLPDTGFRVLHVHWPEKLLMKMTPAQIIALLASFRERGFIMVRTHHNLAPHDLDLPDFEKDLLQVFDGHHCFSHVQRRILADVYGEVLAQSLVLPHPRFPADRVGSGRAPNSLCGHDESAADVIVVGCFGRIRPYKRILEFARAFANRKSHRLKLIIVGLPDTPTIGAELHALTSTWSAIEYHGSFVSHDALIGWMRQVDYVVLPYTRLWSSGVLVLALQLGIPVLSPPPAMLDLSPQDLGAVGTFLNPWNDHCAIEWLHASGSKRSGETHLPESTFPTWDQAAAVLDNFYTTLEARR